MSDFPHIMIVEARFYEDIGDALIEGAINALEEASATYERFQVPGTFELPAAIKIAVRSMDFYDARRRFDGYVALGCVIRGETTHYDYVCSESARGLQDVTIENTLAMGYGVLTCENREQAMARASSDQQDRGGAAARACLAMIDLKRSFHLFPR
jgi:6,7-dimethyl-8-ribityllumazine synthase